MVSFLLMLLRCLTDGLLLCILISQTLSKKIFHFLGLIQMIECNISSFLWTKVWLVVVPLNLINILLKHGFLQDLLLEEVLISLVVYLVVVVTEGVVSINVVHVCVELSFFSFPDFTKFLDIIEVSFQSHLSYSAVNVSC